MPTTLKNSPLFAGFAVDDLDRAKAFYADTLGIRVVEDGPGLLALAASNGYSVLVYAKERHRPAEHTVLNSPVDDVEATVDALRAAGVELEHYDEGPFATDEKGIAGPEPLIAWFHDPAGYILSVIEDT